MNFKLASQLGAAAGEFGRQQMQPLLGQPPQSRIVTLNGLQVMLVNQDERLVAVPVTPHPAQSQPVTSGPVAAGHGDAAWQLPPEQSGQLAQHDRGRCRQRRVRTSRLAQTHAGVRRNGSPAEVGDQGAVQRCLERPGLRHRSAAVYQRREHQVQHGPSRHRCRRPASRHGV